MKPLASRVLVVCMAVGPLGFSSCGPSAYDPAAESLVAKEAAGLKFASRTGIVELNLLKTLSPEVAKEITSECDHLCLNGLEEVSDETAATLAGAHCSLEMASLKKLDNQSLAKKLAARDGVLLLNNISEIQPEVMRAVATHK